VAHARFPRRCVIITGRSGESVLICILLRGGGGL
jgi:hypothetical protein